MSPSEDHPLALSVFASAIFASVEQMNTQETQASVTLEVVETTAVVLLLPPGTDPALVNSYAWREQLRSTLRQAACSGVSGAVCTVSFEGESGERRLSEAEVALSLIHI